MFYIHTHTAITKSVHTQRDTDIAIIFSMGAENINGNNRCFSSTLPSNQTDKKCMTEKKTFNSPSDMMGMNAF